MHAFVKITEAMKDEKNPPKSVFILGMWLARVLTPEDFEELQAFEAEEGEEKANELLCQALVASGKWTRDGEGNVELKPEHATRFRIPTRWEELKAMLARQ